MVTKKAQTNGCLWQEKYTCIKGQVKKQHSCTQLSESKYLQHGTLVKKSIAGAFVCTALQLKIISVFVEWFSHIKLLSGSLLLGYEEPYMYTLCIGHRTNIGTGVLHI